MHVGMAAVARGVAADQTQHELDDAKAAFALALTPPACIIAHRRLSRPTAPLIVLALLEIECHLREPLDLQAVEMNVILMLSSLYISNASSLFYQSMKSWGTPSGSL